MTSDVADGGGEHAGGLVHVVLYSPEAAGCEDGGLGRGTSLHQAAGVAAAALVELGVVVVEETLYGQVVLQLGVRDEGLEAHLYVVSLKMVEY